MKKLHSLGILFIILTVCLSFNCVFAEDISSSDISVSDVASSDVVVEDIVSSDISVSDVASSDVVVEDISDLEANSQDSDVKNVSDKSSSIINLDWENEAVWLEIYYDNNDLIDFSGHGYEFVTTKNSVNLTAYLHVDPSKVGHYSSLKGVRNSTNSIFIPLQLGDDYFEFEFECAGSRKQSSYYIPYYYNVSKPLNMTLNFNFIDSYCEINFFGEMIVTDCIEMDKYVWVYGYFGLNSYNYTIEKVCLNPTVYLGDQVSFLISLTNYGYYFDFNINDFADYGLVFDSFVGDSWYVDEYSMYYYGYLGFGESANCTVTYNTTQLGNLTNRITLNDYMFGFELYDEDSTYVYEPNLGVKVDTLNPIVYLGNQTKFKVTVTNLGPLALNGVYIAQDDFDDLKYASWSPDKGNWEFESVSGLSKWNLLDSLNPNETASFIMTFDTSSIGNKTITIFSSSGKTNETFAFNVTEVIEEEPQPSPTPEPNPKPEPQPSPTPEPNSKPVNNDTDSEPSSDSNSVSKPVVSKMPNTGNPLALVLVSLFVMFVGGLRRKF